MSGFRWSGQTVPRLPDWRCYRTRISSIVYQNWNPPWISTDSGQYFEYTIAGADQLPVDEIYHNERIKKEAVALMRQPPENIKMIIKNG